MTSKPLSPSVSHPDNMVHVVRTLLDKKQDGERIELDWNAFDAATALKEPELKDIHKRLCSEYEYDDIRQTLQRTVHKKRSEILALAKEKVMAKVLQECQLLKLETSHQIVSSKDLLKKWLKQTSGPKSDGAFRQITETTFRESARWNDDMAHELMDIFGIYYDEKTMNPHRNNKGNGFFEKICTKALQNVRSDLRAIRDRARTGTPAPRIKRKKEDCYDGDGKYIRRRHNVSLFLFTALCKSVSYVFYISFFSDIGRL